MVFLQREELLFQRMQLGDFAAESVRFEYAANGGRLADEAAAERSICHERNGRREGVAAGGIRCA